MVEEINKEGKEYEEHDRDDEKIKSQIHKVVKEYPGENLNFYAKKLGTKNITDLAFQFYLMHERKEIYIKRA